jgi:hypothetical protein
MVRGQLIISRESQPVDRTAVQASLAKLSNLIRDLLEILGSDR